MRRRKDKFMAAAGTILFLAAVRTDANPTLWQVALIALGMYEILLLAAEIGRDVARDRRRKERRSAQKMDMQRWADTWIKWPMKGA